MPAKKPKLPELFVQFKDGVAWGTFYKREHGKDDGDKYTVHRYAPVQKPKVCVWTPAELSTLGTHKSSCNWWVTLGRGYVACPYCGGKIKVAR